MTDVHESASPPTSTQTQIMDPSLEKPAAGSNHLTPPEKTPEATSRRTSNDSSHPDSIAKAPTNPEDTKADLQKLETLDRIDTADYPHGIKLAAIILALVLSIFLISLDMTIIATAIPRITDQFNSLQDVGWYGAAFFLTVGAFQSTWGKGYKYFSLKLTFIVSIAIFELGSLICAVAQNSVTLIVGRAIAGLGGAGIGSGAYTIIAFAAPPRLRPAFTGVMGAVYGCSSVAGPLLGGLFTDKVSWRWCFYINLPIGGLSCAIIFLTFTDPAASKPTEASWKEKLIQMDPLGTLAIMAACICYILALQWGGTTKSWSNSDVVGTLVGFGIFIILFIVVEWWGKERAMLPSYLISRRDVAVNCAYVFFLAGSFFALLYYIPIYFQSVDGVSAASSGIHNLPLILAVSISTVISGGMISAFGWYVPWLYAGAVLATVGNGLLYTLDIGTSSSKWIGYQALTGIGLGLSFQVPMIANQSFVKVRDIPSVTAATLFFQTIGGAFFVSAGQTAFTNRIVKRVPVTAPGVNPAEVVATGATRIRKVFPADSIHGIIVAYMSGIKVVFAIAVALSGVTLLIALASPWKRITVKKGNEVDEDEQVQPSEGGNEKAAV